MLDPLLVPRPDSGPDSGLQTPFLLLSRTGNSKTDVHDDSV
jgi:hypothetical protein